MMKKNVKGVLVCLVAGVSIFGGYCCGYAVCRDKMQEDIDYEYKMRVEACTNAAEMQDAYGSAKALYDDMSVTVSNIANLLSRTEIMKSICETNESLQKHGKIYEKLGEGIASWQAALYMTEHPITTVFSSESEKTNKIANAKIGSALVGLNNIMDFSKYVYDVSEPFALNQSVPSAQRLKATECKGMAYNIISKTKELIVEYAADENAVLRAVPELIKDIRKIDAAFYELMLM